VPAALGTEYKYWAFISYSHSDATWAQWLHRALESYRIPRRLRQIGSEQLPKRLYPVFRDRDELPTAPSLSQKIREALAASRFLIVICSPRSAVSPWVNQEIKLFQEQGRLSQILCLIVDGEPNANPALGQLECFAPALLRDEPLAADVRTGKDSRDIAKLKLVAGIIGVSRPCPGRVDTGLRGFCLCLFGGYVADGGVTPVAIVVAFDMGEQVAPRGIAVWVLGLVHEFGF